MELKINTEETNLEELKQALELIKKVIERRDISNETQKKLSPISQPEEEPKIEQPTQEEPQGVEQATPPPSVDISALAMSDYGQKNENRTVNNISSTTQQTESTQQINEKDAVLEIITNLKRKNPNGPLYMQNIISLANAKGIQEEKTRKLVTELKESDSI